MSWSYLLLALAHSVEVFLIRVAMTIDVMPNWLLGLIDLDRLNIDPRVLVELWIFTLFKQIRRLKFLFAT